MKIGELFVALGFDVDDEKLKEFDKNIKESRNNVAKLAAAATGAVWTINAFVKNAVEGSVALRNFETITGDSAVALQQWQTAASQINPALGIDQVTESFKRLATTIDEFKLGKGPIGDFAMLGVNPAVQNTPEKVLEKLRENYQTNVRKWGKSNTANMMNAIGVDPGMINAIQVSREEFNKFFEGKILDPESRNKLVQLGEAMQRLSTHWELFKAKLSAKWSPALIDILDRAVPFLETFGEKIVMAAAGVTAFFIALKALVALTSALRAFALVATAAFAPWVLLLGSAAYLTYQIVTNWEKIKTGMKTPLNFGQVPDWAAKPEIRRFRDWQKSGVDNPADFMRGPGVSNQNAQTNFNNNFNIQSTADAEDVAQSIIDIQQQQLDLSFSGFNNGPRY